LVRQSIFYIFLVRSQSGFIRQEACCVPSAPLMKERLKHVCLASTFGLFVFLLFCMAF